MLGCPFRDLRSDPSRPHLSSCHLAQILKYSPLADTKYDYPHTPTGPYPPPTPSSLTVSGKGSGVAKVVHSLATQRVDQITDQKAPTCIEPDWSLSCNIRGLAGRWRIRREHNPPSPPNSLTKTAYGPYWGLFLFWFQRGLALAAALQRLTKCSKSVSERHLSLTERPTAPKSRLEKMYHLQ